MKILLATWNLEKIRWMTEGLQSLNMKIEPIDPLKFHGGEENGVTCSDNAIKKALWIGAREETIIIAEDSGLFCSGLNGFPGTHTARWAPGDDQDRAKLLIEKLMGNNDRRAYFKSAICILFPNSEKSICEGTLEGNIAKFARGDVKTGYDAIFELKYGKTIAEIEKQSVDDSNHRQKALQLACCIIRKWISNEYKDVR